MIMMVGMQWVKSW